MNVNRSVRVGAAVLVLLHLLAVAFPALLWGVSHGAVWPLPWVVAWGVAVVAVCLAASRLGARLSLPSYPGRRGAALLAAIAGLGYWLCRERAHFLGDGYLLIRDEGFSETATRARLLVELTSRSVRIARAHLGLDPETSLALLAVLAGVAATYAGVRAAAHWSTNRAERWVLAASLGTAGAQQLFCGHVEYYGLVAAGVVVYLALVARGLDGASRGWMWLALAAYGAMLPLHLSTLALAPAHGYLLVHAWRTRIVPRPAVVAAALAIPALTWLLQTLAGGNTAGLSETVWAGLRRYTEPYFDVTSARHAFGFLSGAHWLAVANDVLCSAPLALLALPLVLARAPSAREASLPSSWRFLALAAAGCLAVNVLFARELGPYRDWDILAPYGFVLLAGMAALARARGTEPRSLLVVVVAAGLQHTLPWVLTQASERAALAHVELVLAGANQWSPHARAYMHEEIAIQHREQGDMEGATREYEAAVRANPADARYHVGLGNQHAQGGRMQDAAREYRLALETRADYAPAHNNLAFVLASLGQELDPARGHAQRALQIEPDNADYWLTLARVEVAAGRRDAARAAVEQALRFRPAFPKARQLLQTLDVD